MTMTALLTTEDIVAGIVLGLAALAAIIAALVKVGQHIAALAHQTRAVRNELKPDHGSSLRDSTDRIEAAIANLTRDVARVESTQRGMARDIGRLSSEDQSIRDHAADEHGRIWDAINRKDHTT